MVDLEWYRSFVAVYQFGTASGAARALHLTQPGISQHVAALEKALGTPLFVRAPRRMVPTEDGHRLYTQVTDAIERLESVGSGGSSARTPQHVRLGAPREFFSERILPRLAREDRTHYTVRFGLSGQLIEGLAAGELDLVMATQRGARAGIAYRPLFRETFWLVAPPGTVLPSPGDPDGLLALERVVREERWISYGPELPIIRRFWRQVFARRLDTTPQLIIPDLQGIRAAVGAGLGVSVLPDYLCERWVARGRLTLALAPTTPVTNDLWLAYRTSEGHTGQMRAVLRLLDARDGDDPQGNAG